MRNSGDSRPLSDRSRVTPSALARGDGDDLFRPSDNGGVERGATARLPMFSADVGTSVSSRDSAGLTVVMLRDNEPLRGGDEGRERDMAAVLLRASRVAMGILSTGSGMALTEAERPRGCPASSGAPVGVCPRRRRVMPVKVV